MSLLQENALVAFAYTALAGTLAAYLGSRITDFFLHKFRRNSEES